ncbi:MAG: Co2+/Mg2+ efflux protein ApaG [Pseudomonadota bacterium]
MPSKTSSTPLAYEAVTQGIRVRVVPHYLADQSDPAESRWVWAYAVEIHNEGDVAVQLRDRHWEITDANGAVQVVDGAGVVGKQPILKPGESFEYTSGCPLPTPSGFMVGHYSMVQVAVTQEVTRTAKVQVARHMQPFDVAIPAFSLDLPSVGRKRLH